MGKTMDEILTEMLAEVDDSIDKREGSLIWSALAPTAAQLAEGYAFLDSYLDLLMADTAVGEYLERLCGLVGLTRNAATRAVVIGEFRDGNQALMNVPIGTEFGCGTVVYTVTETISIGKAFLTAKSSGIAGNLSEGILLPLTYVEGLFSAEIVGISQYAEEAESDEHLRARYIENLTVPAFGGNVSDYEQKALSFDGVGAVKVFPAVNGGGTVGLVIGSEMERAVDSSLVTAITNAFNQVDEEGFSCGLAPIGHTVTVESADNLEIDITAEIVLEEGISTTDIQEDLEEAVARYLAEISFTQSMIHSAPVEVAMLSVGGVADILSITLNETKGTLHLSKTFSSYQVPVLGTLTLEVS